MAAKSFIIQAPGAFVPIKPFHPRILLESKARSLPQSGFVKVASLRYVPLLLTNIRLGLPWTLYLLKKIR